MNKKVLILSLTIAMLALPISAAYATKPTPVSGTIFIETPATQIPRFAGKSGNFILEFIGGNVEWSGDIVGDAYYTGSRWVISQNAVVTYNIYTFDEVTVDGKTGSMRIEMTFTYKGTLTGRWRIMGGTGELAGIHGQGTLGFFGGYSGQVHFDP